tara:strand:+ start:2453 stop:3532 length:1080 start_codon:yes stop_codon:yes gene_type:complete
MAIASTTDFWTARMNGEDPTALVGNEQTNWTKSVTGTSSAVNGNWVISANEYYTQTPTTNAYTMVAIITFSNSGALPSNGTVLMSLDNGTKKVEVRAKGNASTLDLVGATTVTTRDLDIDASEGDDNIPLVLRLTLDSAGNAKLYMREIIEDDDGADNFISVAGASGSTKEAKWGNSSGTVTWHNVYYTDAGAFTPDEMALSDWTTNTMMQMGLSIVQVLRDCVKPYIKTHLSDSAINYAYDLSSDMISRISAPSIHVLLDNVSSPEFETLSGTRAIQNYGITIYVVTRGSTYQSAYRMGMDIVGEVFDELYVNTGVDASTDSIQGYNVQLDTKTDDDEIVCIHQIGFSYMRRINLLHR